MHLLFIVADLVLNRLDLPDLLQQEIERITVLEEAKTEEASNTQAQETNTCIQQIKQQTEQYPKQQQGNQLLMSQDKNNEDEGKKSQQISNKLFRTEDKVCDTSLQDLFNLSSVEDYGSPKSDNRPMTSTQIPSAEPRRSFDVSEVTCSVTSVNPKIPSPVSTAQIMEVQDKENGGHDQDENVEKSETQAGKLVYTKDRDHKMLIRKQKNKNLVKNLKQMMEAQKDTCSESKETSVQHGVHNEEEASQQRNKKTRSPKENSAGDNSLQESCVVGNSYEESDNRKGISPSTLTKLKKFQRIEATTDSTDTSDNSDKSFNKPQSKENQGPLSGYSETMTTKGEALSQSFDEKQQPYSKNIFRVDKKTVTNMNDSLDDLLNSPESTKLSVPEKLNSSAVKSLTSGPSWLTKVQSLKSPLFKLDNGDNDDLDDLDIDFDFNPSKRVKIG